MLGQGMKARIRYESIEVEVLDGTAAEVADLVSRLKRDRGLKGITPTVAMSEMDTAVPSKEAMLDWLRKQPKARHSVRGLMQALMGTTIPARVGKKSNPDYLRLLARLDSARAELAAERGGKWRTLKQGKETLHALE